MPHGKWVAFEGDDPHKCDIPRVVKPRPRLKPTPEPPVGGRKPFEPYYPPTPTPPPEPSGEKVEQPTRLPPRPATVVRPFPVQEQSSGRGWWWWIILLIIAGFVIRAMGR